VPGKVCERLGRVQLWRGPIVRRPLTAVRRRSGGLRSRAEENFALSAICPVPSAARCSSRIPPVGFDLGFGRHLRLLPQSSSPAPGQSSSPTAARSTRSCPVRAYRFRADSRRGLPPDLACSPTVHFVVRTAAPSDSICPGTHRGFVYFRDIYLIHDILDAIVIPDWLSYGRSVPARLYAT
jgi:hypothetical protein